MVIYWGSGNYSSKKAYKILLGQQQTSPLFAWLWSYENLGKHKFFFWLLLRDRLNTIDSILETCCEGRIGT